jgi:hypothetical protein
VNTEHDEYHPTVTRDGRSLYFVRRMPTLQRRGDFYRIDAGGLLTARP